MNKPIATALVIILTMATGAAAAPAKPTTRPADQSSFSRGGARFQAQFKVVIDDAAAEDNHVEPGQINGVVQKFLESHDTFTLAEVQNIKIRASNGRDVLLQEVASVQVTFHRIKK